MSLIPKHLEAAFLWSVYRDLPLIDRILPPPPNPPGDTFMRSSKTEIEYPTIAFGPYGECVKEMQSMVIRDEFFIDNPTEYPTFMPITTE